MSGAMSWSGRAPRRPRRPCHRSAQAQPGRSATYTPPYLAEKILTARSALEGERKQVTVLLCRPQGLDRN